MRYEFCAAGVNHRSQRDPNDFSPPPSQLARPHSSLQVLANQSLARPPTPSPDRKSVRPSPRKMVRLHTHPGPTHACHPNQPDSTPRRAVPAQATAKSPQWRRDRTEMNQKHGERPTIATPRVNPAPRPLRRPNLQPRPTMTKPTPTHHYPPPLLLRNRAAGLAIGVAAVGTQRPTIGSAAVPAVPTNPAMIRKRMAPPSPK